MRPLIFTVIFCLTISFYAKGNMDCIWSSSKAGITISYVASCEFKNKTFVDSILNDIVASLNRQDTSLQILVLVNAQGLTYPNNSLKTFITVGFDTLNLLDEDFIYEYYQNKTILSEEANNGSNLFESRLEPIDISSTKSKAVKHTGIKIIYNTDYRVGKPNWTEIKKLIQYSFQNLQVIKATQKRDTVRYWANGWYISLVTIDTNQINKILEKPKAEIKQKLTKTKQPVKYFVFGLGVLFFCVFVFWVRRKHSSQH